MWSKHSLPFASALFLFFSLTAQNALSQDQSFKPLRYEEDYSYLKSDTLKSWYDKMKFWPLSTTGETYISFGGEVRHQYFWYKNQDWGEEPQDKDGYILTRYLGSADFHAGKHFRAFVQLQSSLDDGSKSVPSAVDQNPLDLHQAFFDVSFLPVTNKDLIFRLGRQELAYGSQRFVSVREGPNNRQSFDAARLIFREPNFRLDAFYGNYVAAKPGIFDDKFNKNTALWGTYAVFNKIPLLHNIDLYYLGINRQHAFIDEGKGKEVRHTVGSRIWNSSPNWFYDLEGVYQFGTFKSSVISAWTISLNCNYTFKNIALRPQLGLKTELISGDQKYGDGRINTFDALFPKGAYFGLASVIGPSNLSDIHPYFSLLLSKRLLFSTDLDMFWRMSAADGIYGINAALLYSGKNTKAKAIGNQVESMLEYTVNKFLYLRADFTFFKAGEYLKEVSPGKNISMASTTVQFKF